MNKIINYGHLLPLLEVSDCFKNTNRTSVSDTGWTYTNYDIITQDLNEQLLIGQLYEINFNTIIRSIGDLPIKNLIFIVEMDYDFKVVYHEQETDTGTITRFPNEVLSLNVDENESFKLIYTPTSSNNHLIKVSMYDGDRLVCMKYFNVLMLKRYSEYSISSDLESRYPCITNIEKSNNVFLNTSLIQEAGYDNVKVRISTRSIDGFTYKQNFKIKYNIYVFDSLNGVCEILLGNIPYNWSGAQFQILNIYDIRCGKWYYDILLISGDDTILDLKSYLVETYQDFPLYNFTNNNYNNTRLIPGLSYEFHYTLTSTDHSIHSACSINLRMTTSFGNFRIKYNDGSKNVVKSSSLGSILVLDMITLNGSNDFDFYILFTYSSAVASPTYHGTIFTNEYCSEVSHEIDGFSETFSNARELVLGFNFDVLQDNEIEYSEDRYVFSGNIISTPNDYISTRTWHLRIKPSTDNEFDWTGTNIVYNNQTTLLTGTYPLYIKIGIPDSLNFSKNITFSILPMVDQTTKCGIDVAIGYFVDNNFTIGENDIYKFTILDNIPEYSSYNVEFIYDTDDDMLCEMFESVRFKLKFTRVIKGRKDRRLTYFAINGINSPHVHGNITPLLNDYHISVFWDLDKRNLIVNNIYIHPNLSVIDCNINDLYIKEKTIFPVFQDIDLLLDLDEFITNYIYGTCPMPPNMFFMCAYKLDNSISNTIESRLFKIEQKNNSFIVFHCSNTNMQNMICMIGQIPENANITCELYNCATGLVTTKNYQGPVLMVHYVNQSRDRIYNDLCILKFKNHGQRLNEGIYIQTFDPTEIYYSAIFDIFLDSISCNFSESSNKFNIEVHHSIKYGFNHIGDINRYTTSIKIHNNDNLGVGKNFEIMMYDSADSSLNLNTIELLNIPEKLKQNINNIINRLVLRNGSIRINQNVLTDESIEKLNSLNWTILYYD